MLIEATCHHAGEPARARMRLANPEKITVEGQNEEDNVLMQSFKPLASVIPKTWQLNEAVVSPCLRPVEV